MAAGVASAATLATGIAIGVGVLAGAAVGATADVIRDGQRGNAAAKAFFTLKHGQPASVAEEGLSVLDDAMTPLGGTIYRRENDARTNAAFGPRSYNGYIYPYYYNPMFC